MSQQENIEASQTPSKPQAVVRSQHELVGISVPPCPCSLCGDWIEEGGIYEVDSLNRPICDSCAQWLIMRMPIGAGAADLIGVNIGNFDQETHKSQPEHIPLSSGVIGAGGAVDMQRTTTAPLPDSNTTGQATATKTEE